MLPELNHEEIMRYSRHLLIPEVGLDGQKKLKGSSILLIGTGGLGSPVALYLAAAGIGRIGLPLERRTWCIDEELAPSIAFTTEDDTIGTDRHCIELVGSL